MIAGSEIERKVTLDAGSRRRSRPHESRSRRPHRRQPKRSYVPLIVGGSVTFAFVVTATFTGIAAIHQHDMLSSTRMTIRPIAAGAVRRPARGTPHRRLHRRRGRRGRGHRAAGTTSAVASVTRVSIQGCGRAVGPNRSSGLVRRGLFLERRTWRHRVIRKWTAADAGKGRWGHRRHAADAADSAAAAAARHVARRAGRGLGGPGGRRVLRPFVRARHR